MFKLYFKKFLVTLRLCIVLPLCLNKKQKKALFGKIRRFYLSNMNKKKVDFFISERKGQCLRCGHSCQMGFTCPAFDTEKKLCTINEIKPLVCKMFPLTPEDLEDRNFLGSTPACGYYWTKSHKELSQDFKTVSD